MRSAQQTPSGMFHVKHSASACASFLRAALTEKAIQIRNRICIARADCSVSKERSCAVRLFQPNVMLQLEVLIIGAKINNALDKSGKLGNAGPAEEKIQNSHSDFAEIELVNTESTEENCKNTGGLLAFLRPGRIDGAYINRLRRCLLKHDLLRRDLLKDDLLRRLCLRSGKFFSTESAFRYSRIKRSTTLRTFCCYHERFLPFCLLPIAYIGKTIIQ